MIDTDGDGVLNPHDAFPNDPSNWTFSYDGTKVDTKAEYILDNSSSGNTYALNKNTTNVKFYDSGGGANVYNDNEDYIITFKSPIGTLINLSGGSSIEYYYDKLILTGIVPQNTVILSGLNPDTDVTTFSNELIVKFTSDASMYDDGWNFTLNLMEDSNYINLDIDLDGDNVSNTVDPDDDNDGVLDVNDAFPSDASETLDPDGDGIGNNADQDDDNDGVLDVNDALPNDASETLDTDGDGVGNNADQDDDNDGVLDVNDAFPNDASETLDTDGDGIGDNGDDFPLDLTLGVRNNFLIWTRIGADIDGEAMGDESGSSVSLSADGSIVAIGARYNNGNGSGSGHVRVYQNINTVWTQIGADIDGEDPTNYSGESVSLSADGTIVAIGARTNTNENGTFSGHVRVYQYDSNKDFADSNDSSDNFGPIGWKRLGADIDGEAPSDKTGFSVSLSADGTIVAIGATGNDGNGNLTDMGCVKVYNLVDGSGWTLLGQKIVGEVAGDWSGHSVSLSADGSIVAIGAIINAGNGTFSGHVRVYKYDGTVWTQIGSDIDGEAENDWSGYSVSLSADGSIVAIGATGNDGNGSSSGHVRVYKYDGAVWIQIGGSHYGDIDGETAYDNSGHSVSLSADGTIVAIGAYRNDGNDGTENNSGHVRVYKLSSDLTIKVKAGWNNISCTIAVHKNQIIDNSNSNIISDIWKYDDIYKKHPINDPLDPEKGYWVKCTEAGYLFFKNKNIYA